MQEVNFKGFSEFASQWRNPVLSQEVCDALLANPKLNKNIVRELIYGANMHGVDSHVLQMHVRGMGGGNSSQASLVESNKMAKWFAQSLRSQNSDAVILMMVNYCQTNQMDLALGIYDFLIFVFTFVCVCVCVCLIYIFSFVCLKN